MRYCSASETAKRWKISTPLVRRYCVQGRIIGAVYKNDAWLIPEDAEKPGRQESKSLEPQLAVMPPLAAKLYHQMNGRNYHGLYDYTQINLTSGGHSGLEQIPKKIYQPGNGASGTL